MKPESATPSPDMVSDSPMGIPKEIIFIHCIWVLVLLFTLVQYLRKTIFGRIHVTVTKDKGE